MVISFEESSVRLWHEGDSEPIEECSGILESKIKDDSKKCSTMSLSSTFYRGILMKSSLFSKAPFLSCERLFSSS
jgi:hypothetical protein